MYLFFSFDATILVNKDVYISLKSGNCDALQLEPLDVAPMVPRFNYVARIAPAAYSKFNNSTTSTDPCTGVLKLTQSVVKYATAELSTIFSKFSSPVYQGNHIDMGLFEGACIDLRQIWGGRGPIIVACKIRKAFRYLAPLRNEGSLKAIWVEN